MAVAVGPRERAIFSNSLAPLLLGLVGHSAIVELKKDIQVSGKIVAVDCFTNITMERAVMIKLDGSSACFDLFFIPMRSLRAVQIPDYIPMPQTLQDQVAVVTGAKLKEERKKAKERQQKLRQKKLQRRAEQEAKLKEKEALEAALKGS